MIRQRLGWFAFGFTAASATIGVFVYKDLQAHRNAHFSQANEEYNVLNTRVTNLERVCLNNPKSNVQSGGSDLK